MLVKGQDSRTLIGVVTWTKLDKYEEPIAFVRPLIESKGGAWEEVRDPEQEFPERGQVFWPKATNAEKGNLFHFRAKANGIRKEGGDDFMLVEPRPVFEVLDLRWVGDCEQVRRALSSGIQIPSLPPSKLVIWCKGGLLVGPIQLAIGSGGLATLEGSNRARISCFQFSDADIQQFAFEGITRSIITKPSLGPPQSFVDWDDDRAALKRALDYAVKHSAHRSLEGPKQLIEEALKSLTKNGSSADNLLEVYRLTRSRSLATDVTQLDSYAAEVIAALRKHPKVIAEFEQLKVAERAAARTDASDALASERKQLADLQEERTAVARELRDAQISLAETETLVRDQTRDIEGKIRSRIAEVLSDTPALLANVSLLKPFLGGTHKSESSVETSVAPWKRCATKISDFKGLRAKVIPSLKAMGVPTTAYQPIHAALAGGLLPVVAGSRALEALLAYAHVATGGRSLVIQATSAFGDVQDLFGRVVERHFIPQAAGLIDVVRAATKSEGLFLVILEGINRGATESYLLPLVKSALRRTVEISLFHPSAVESTDPYKTSARIEWPKNVLLAATLIEGPTTLPVAPDLWSDGVLIQVDLEGTGGVATGLGNETSEIDHLSALLGTTPSFDNSEWIQEVAVGAHSVAGQFEGGLRTLTNDVAVIQQNITKCVVVPFLASIENEDERNAQIEVVKKTAGNSVEGWIAAARRRIS